MIESVEQAIRHLHERTGLALDSLTGGELSDSVGFWVVQPFKGGVMAAMAPDGSLFMGGSSVSPSVIEKMFRDGVRSDPADLDEFREWNLGAEEEEDEDW